MNSKRKTIARVCIASLVGLVPATPSLAIQLNSPTSMNAAEASPAHSILEPIPVAATAVNQPVENVLPQKQCNTPSHTARGSLAMFQQVDAIAVAAATPENSLVPAGFDLEDEGDRSSMVGLANIDPNSDRFQRSLNSSDAKSKQSSLAFPAEIANSNEQPILVHPPASHPTAPNRRYFRIENTGDVVAKNVAVELNIPVGARVMEVVPYDTEVIGQVAHYRLRKIEAGQSITVELTTTPDSPTDLVFESRYSMDPLQRIARRSTPAMPTQAQRSFEAPATKLAPPTKKASYRNRAFPRTDVAPSSTPAFESRSEKTPQAAADNESAAATVQVRSGAIARKTWQQDSRLKYGATSIPGKVMVANPQANVGSPQSMNNPGGEASEPFPRTPSAVDLENEQLTENEAFEDDPSAPQVGSDSIEPQVVASRTTSDGLKLTSQLRTRIEGPQHAVTGEEAEYEVVVENNSIKDAKDVIVQLAIPAGLEVTTLDRNAWFDGKARTITWKVPAVDAGNSETIRYLAKITSPIGQLQTVTLGVENKFRGRATFQSTVMDQYELAAPLMSFEKDAKSLK